MNSSSNKVLLQGAYKPRKIVLGSVVRLSKQLGDALKHEHGVCYEVFHNSRGGEIVEGYSFIFERGYCTSLLSDDVKSRLLVTNRVSKAHQHRWFTYISDVLEHWRQGGFDDAFKTSTSLQLVK